VLNQPLLEAWPHIVGDQVAQHVELTEVRDGVLLLRTASASWKAELNFRKNDILAKANTILKQNRISDLRFI
jgi:predicted nucleic acid-binding Zn ribbon protein